MIKKTINITSEINPLKKVLLHRPGVELEHLTPDYLQRLLFDDIPFLKRAQKEHDAFARALEKRGVEVLYLSRLMAQVLDKDPQIRESFVSDFLYDAGTQVLNCKKELYSFFMDIEDSHDLVLQTMQGIYEEDFDRGKVKRNPLVKLTQPRTGFILDPIPNLYFTRDPMAAIGQGVSINKMSSQTRARETIFGRYILTYHPDFAGKVPFYYEPDMPFSIEGGDIFNLSSKTLAIGLSERTTAEAVEALARNIFSDENSQIENILAFDIPNMRAFMHLDTVFTQADKDVFLVHPGILGSLKVYRVFKGPRRSLKAEAIRGSLETVLCKYLELDSVKLIRCGGNNSIASQREQWNDGSNVLCISPGTVIVYDRNAITNEILRDNGLHTIEIPSSELSRGRGGPRCMSMPLERA